MRLDRLTVTRGTEGLVVTGRHQRRSIVSDTARGAGRTRDQIKNAPRGAVFVWCSRDTRYPVDLAKQMGRFDLSIKPPSWLDWRNIAGVRIPNVVLDHSLDLTPEGFQDALIRLLTSGTKVV